MKVFNSIEGNRKDKIMGRSKFDPYKVKHLFLLVGENPLPNYVAAKLLIKDEGTPYLVHTTGTLRQAQRLQKILKCELVGFQPAQLISLEAYESDAYQIQNRISEKVKSIDAGRIGLNYTGGTKAMAVHAYRAVFEFMQKDEREVVFSYLDPRRLEICIDREDGESVPLKIKPEDLEVKLAKIFQIHGWQWLSEPDYQPKLSETSLSFAEFHSDPETSNLWRQWCNKVLRGTTQVSPGRWHKESVLKQASPLPLDLPSHYHEEPSPKSLTDNPKIVKALNTLVISPLDEFISLQEIQKEGFKDITNLCKWLDGEWLEDYTLQQIQKIDPKLRIHESAASFWIKDPASKEKRTKFQFDVAFTRGYQLFAISCTTIDYKSGCKQKLFEAYVRARQLGGDEARVALVCCADRKDVNSLKKEITNVLKSNPEFKALDDSKLTVFGREDLLTLSDKIALWIQDNDAELDA
jgi:hypothetical protein